MQIKPSVKESLLQLIISIRSLPLLALVHFHHQARLPFEEVNFVLFTRKFQTADDVKRYLPWCSRRTNRSIVIVFILDFVVNVSKARLYCVFCAQHRHKVLMPLVQNERIPTFRRIIWSLLLFSWCVRSDGKFSKSILTTSHLVISSHHSRSSGAHHQYPQAVTVHLCCYISNKE